MLAEAPLLNLFEREEREEEERCFGCNGGGRDGNGPMSARDRKSVV